MTIITGHRGARNLWPENSMTGFRNALALGIDGMEFDIHLTRDRELVVIHDATLDRTAEATGRVADLTAARRAAIRLRDSNDGIPLLDDVLGLLTEWPGVSVHAEIKADADGNRYPGLEARVFEALTRHGLAERSWMTGFDPAVLAECQRIAPKMPLVMSITAASAERHGGFDAALAAADRMAAIVAVHHPLLEARWSEVTARVAKERLCAWTLNEPELIGHWLDRGIGYITSDRPDIALDLRRQRSTATA